jgi:hypothetical protein
MLFRRNQGFSKGMTFLFVDWPRLKSTPAEQVSENIFRRYFSDFRR